MPNRPRNPSGFVRKHPDTLTTRWQGIVKYPDPDQSGQWKSRSQTFERKAEAQKWVDDTVAEHRQNPQYRPPSDMTLGQYMSRWLDTMAQRVRPNTLRSYRQMAQHIITGLGDKPLNAVTALDLQRLYSQLGETHSARTVAYVHTIVRHALQDAEDWNLISRNPARKAHPPHVETQNDRPIPTPQESQKWLKAVEGDRWQALWVWLTLTGTRRGEALGLRWEDIDWTTQTVRIRRTVSGQAAHRQLGPVKTGHGQRSVALSPYLIQVLKRRQRQQLADHLLAGPQWQDTGLVFTTRTGGMLEPRNVFRRFKQLLNKAGLPPGYRIHDLRHAMATHWLSNGVPIKVVSERLGHSSAAFTLQVYGHVLPHQQAEAAEAMEQALLGNGVTTRARKRQKRAEKTACAATNKIAQAA